MRLNHTDIATAAVSVRACPARGRRPRLAASGRHAARHSTDWLVTGCLAFPGSSLLASLALLAELTR